MFLLRIFELMAFAILAGLILTQIVMPLIFGTRFFPMFRNSELKQKVDEVRDEVADLREQSQQLTELEQLMKQRQELEAKINALTPKEGN